jgi:hypothetical protein
MPVRHVLVNALKDYSPLYPPQHLNALRIAARTQNMMFTIYSYMSQNLFVVKVLIM